MFILDCLKFRFDFTRRYYLAPLLTEIRTIAYILGRCMERNTVSITAY
jgi:hypothetical protein